MQQVQAKKALGQHFLTDEAIAKRIAEILSSYQLPVLEVGGGMGVLTQYLLKMYPDVRVVELDSESVNYLRTHFPHALSDRIIEGDFLKMDLTRVFGTSSSPYAVIGNFPYNISTQIFFKILDHKDLIPVAGGMLQKEVATRLAAPAGTRAGGILSVLLQVWYDIEYLFSVPPSVFNPPPRVQSGVIRLTRNQRTELGVDDSFFRQVVKIAFNQRRKTLRNALKPIVGNEEFPAEASQYMTMRAEQLTVDDFISLTHSLESLR